jgi:hypothetical protein
VGIFEKCLKIVQNLSKVVARECAALDYNFVDMLS